MPRTSRGIFYFLLTIAPNIGSIEAKNPTINLPSRAKNKVEIRYDNIRVIPA